MMTWQLWAGISQDVFTECPLCLEHHAVESLSDLIDFVARHNQDNHAEPSTMPVQCAERT